MVNIILVAGLRIVDECVRRGLEIVALKAEIRLQALLLLELVVLGLDFCGGGSVPERLCVAQTLQPRVPALKRHCGHCRLGLRLGPRLGLGLGLRLQGKCNSIRCWSGAMGCKVGQERKIVIPLHSHSALEGRLGGGASTPLEARGEH